MDTYDPNVPSGNTLNRFHETSARFQRYKVLLRRRWWFLLLTAAIAICFQALRITGKNTEYIAIGRILAGMQVQLGEKGATFENRFLEEFYGTQIEMLAGHRRARHGRVAHRVILGPARESEPRRPVRALRDAPLDEQPGSRRSPRVPRWDQLPRRKLGRDDR